MFRKKSWSSCHSAQCGRNFSKNFVYHFAAIDCDQFAAVAMLEVELVLIEAECVQDRRVKIIRMDWAFDCRIPDFIRRSDHLATANSATGEPRCVTRWRMIAARL